MTESAGRALEQSEEELQLIIEELCSKKVEEFALYGYENVSSREIWKCVSEKYNGALPPLHQLVNDILSLKASKFMNWMTLNAYKGVDLD